MTTKLVEVPIPEHGRTTGPKIRPFPRPAPHRISPPSRGRALLEDHFDLIRQKLERLSRSSGLPEHEAEELRSWALFKLVENDYRILARWEGRSSFSTYLNMVLVNLMRDYRIQLWGKWRPSAAARRMGGEAILLERLLTRDGLSLEEAVDRLQRNGTTLSRAELERMAAKLPPRSTERRRTVGEEELLRVAVDGQVEHRVRDGESARLASWLRKELLPLLRELPTEDQLLLKLHYRDGLTMAEVSRMLGLPQRELYPRRDRCLKKLRRALEAAGLCGAILSELISSSWELPDGNGIWE